MEFQLSRALLRTWRPDDGPALVRHANNERVARSLRDRFPHPYTEEDAEAWLALVTSPDHDLVWAIEVGGEAAGGIDLRPGEDIYTGSAEIGYWLGEEHWNNGIITEAIATITAYGFEELGLRRIHAEVFAPNAASARVLEKCGYTLEARLRQAVIKRGVVLYAIRRDEWMRPNGP